MPICLFHAVDHDGQGSGAIVKQAIPECEMIGVDYGQALDWDKFNDQVVYVVDFTLQPYEQMAELKQRAKNVIWIDHHISSINAVSELGLTFEGIQEVGRAAIELTWEFFHPMTEPPWAVKLIGAHDLWNHTHPDTWPFFYGLAVENTHPDNQELWKKLFSDHPATYQEAIAGGRKIQQFVKMDHQRFAEQAAFETVLPNGLKAIACNRGLAGSTIFDSVYDPQKHDLKIVFYLQKDKWRVSMYTDKNNIDCSEIAATYGGGGHKKAAGCRFKTLPVWLGGTDSSKFLVSR